LGVFEEDDEDEEEQEDDSRTMVFETRSKKRPRSTESGAD
jgi:hypothetical protein